MVRPPRTDKPTTRDRIVDSAIALFNEQGVSTVTTNHVAEHAEISPGNLYYHFANKEEIIREAFERVNDAADAIWTAPLAGALPRGEVQSFHAMLIGNLELFRKFAFLARELPALLRADPLLRARYTEVAGRRMRALEELLHPFIKAGLLRGLEDPEDLRALVETAWVIGLFCIPYAETSDGAAVPRTARARTARLHDAIERGALLVLHLLRPNLDALAYAGLVVLVRSQFEQLKG